MASMSIKRFESPENQQALRQALIDWSRMHPMGEEELATKVGISHSTLRRFWKQCRDVDYKTLCYINLFVNPKGE